MEHMLMTHMLPEMPRRDALKRLAVGVGVGASAALTGACTNITPIPASPTLPRPMREFVMMRGSLDDRLVIGFLSGQYYGVVDDEIMPLFGVLSATFSLWRERPEGGFAYATFEHAYYTDIESGEVLSEWRNPFNGQVGKVPVWTSQPSWNVVSPELGFNAGRPSPPGTSIEHRVVSSADVAGERVVVERVRFVSRPAAPAKPYKYAELVTMRAATAALADPSAMRVPCSTSLAGAGSWRPWLQMGDQPGHLMAHGTGRYGAQIDELPKVWLAAAQAGRPELLKDTRRILESATRR